LGHESACHDRPLCAVSTDISALSFILCRYTAQFLCIMCPVCVCVCVCVLGVNSSTMVVQLWRKKKFCG
jgi:hypothetical protein